MHRAPNVNLRNLPLQLDNDNELWGADRLKDRMETTARRRLVRGPIETIASVSLAPHNLTAKWNIYIKRDRSSIRPKSLNVKLSNELGSHFLVKVPRFIPPQAIMLHSVQPTTVPFVDERMDRPLCDVMMDDDGRLIIQEDPHTKLIPNPSWRRLIFPRKAFPRELWKKPE